MKYIGKLFFVVCLMAAFWACSDDDSPALDEPINTEDVENIGSIGETTEEFTEVVTFSNEIISDVADQGGRAQNICYGVIDESETENRITINFEPECVGEDGRVRSGSLILSWEGALFGPDFSYTITFDQYIVDDHQLDGSVTVGDLVIEQNRIGFSVVVSNGRLIYPDQRDITYGQDLTYDLNFGEEFSMTVEGSLTGTNLADKSYVADTNTPIKWIDNCDHPVSGSFTASFDGRQPLTVDYGDGTCDNQAMLTRGSESLSVDIDD